jgi:hypothetical protein
MRYSWRAPRAYAMAWAPSSRRHIFHPPLPHARPQSSLEIGRETQLAGDTAGGGRRGRIEPLPRRIETGRRAPRVRRVEWSNTTGLASLSFSATSTSSFGRGADREIRHASASAATRSRTADGSEAEAVVRRACAPAGLTVAAACGVGSSAHEAAMRGGRGPARGGPPVGRRRASAGRWKGEGGTGEADPAAVGWDGAGANGC